MASAQAIAAAKSLYANNPTAMQYNPGGPAQDAINYWAEQIDNDGLQVVKNSFNGTVASYAQSHPLPGTAATAPAAATPAPAAVAPTPAPTPAPAPVAATPTPVPAAPASTPGVGIPVVATPSASVPAAETSPIATPTMDQIPTGSMGAALSSGWGKTAQANTTQGSATSTADDQKRAAILQAYKDIGNPNGASDQSAMDYWMSSTNGQPNFTGATSLYTAAANPQFINGSDPILKAASTKAYSLLGKTPPANDSTTSTSSTTSTTDKPMTREDVIAAYSAIGRNDVPQADIDYWVGQTQKGFLTSAAQVKTTDPKIQAAVDAAKTQLAGITNNTTNTTNDTTINNSTVAKSLGSDWGLNDYVAAAKQMATDSAQLNRYNQSTPTGQQTWSKDASGNWTLTQSLSPDQQKMLDSTTQLNQGLATGLNSNLQNATDSLKPIDQSKLTASPTNAGTNTQAALMSRLAPEYDRQKKSLDNTLANQGLGIGSEAWQNAQNQFGQQQNDLFTQAGLQGITADQNARSTQIQQETALANQPLNAFNSLRTGLAAQTPALNSVSSIAPADYLGAASLSNQTNQQNAQNQIATNNANIGATNSLQNGLFSLGGTALSLFGK